VIFTKRDGAVVKEISDIIDQLTKDSPEIAIGRSVKKEARGKADVKVTNRVNELEGELRALSLAGDAVAFLTTSGMFSLVQRYCGPFNWACPQGWRSVQSIRITHAKNSSS
jgi:hypothetical protein